MKITHCKLKKKVQKELLRFLCWKLPPVLPPIFWVSKGRRGRGAAGKVVVFGILKRNGRVYTVIVDNAKSETLLPVIKKKIMPDSIVYTDSLSSYDKLDVSGFIHYHINHSKEFADRQNHINGIENF